MQLSPHAERALDQLRAEFDEAAYRLGLLERIRTSTIDELTTVLAFFDCAQLRPQHMELLQAVCAELKRRGIHVP
jgi:hypothetical protein